MAHLINAQVTALVLDLGGEDHGLALGLRPSDEVIIAPRLPVGDAAHTEAFDEHAPAVFQGKGQVVRGEAGDELHQGDIGLQIMVKRKLRLRLGTEIRKQTTLLHHP